MTYYSISNASLATLLTSLNNQAVPGHHVVGFFHDGTNYVVIYWK